MKKKSVLMAGDHKGVMAHNSFGGGRTLDFGCGTEPSVIALSPTGLSLSLLPPPPLFFPPCAPPGVSGHANSHYRRFIGNLIWLTRANRQSALSRNCHGFELKSAKSNWQSPHFAS